MAPMTIVPNHLTIDQTLRDPCEMFFPSFERWETERLCDLSKVAGKPAVDHGIELSTCESQACMLSAEPFSC